MNRFLSLWIVLLLAGVSLGSGDFERANSDNLTITDNAALSLTYTAGWTLSVWCKLDSIAGTGDNCVFMLTDTTNHIYLYMREQTAPADKWYFGAAGLTADSSTFDASTEWTHLAIVGSRPVTNEVVDYYCNGTAAQVTGSGGVDVNPTSTTLGINYAGTFKLDGKLADFGLWHAALNSTQINALVNGSHPSEVGTVAVYLPMYDDATDEAGSLEVTNSGVTFDSGADQPPAFDEGSVVPILFNQRMRRR
jgi:hypothetical protein